MGEQRVKSLAMLTGDRLDLLRYCIGERQRPLSLDRGSERIEVIP